MRLHMVGLPHTQTVTEAMTVCAFTQKLVKFGEMMTPLGYDIIVYSGKHNDMVCSEHVPVFTMAQQKKWYGTHDPNLLPTVATWDVNAQPWRQMNHRAIAEISERIEPEDVILLLAGRAQQPIAEAFPEFISAEWAAGYDGIFAAYVCYESYAWMHYLYGLTSQNHGGEGRWCDTVIPNFFRPDDFSLADDRDDYLLYVGRVTYAKGVHIATQIATATGRKLVVAGSGVEDSGPDFLKSTEGFTITGTDIEYVGVVGVEERNKLMGRAHALIASSTYLEPFGAVVVEAQMCGTPVIAPDWGAYTETIDPGVTGYRFRSLGEAVRAVEQVEKLTPSFVREQAISRYSLEAIGPRYDRWLRQLGDLHRGGWYTIPA